MLVILTQGFVFSTQNKCQQSHYKVQNTVLSVTKNKLYYQNPKDKATLERICYLHLKQQIKTFKMFQFVMQHRHLYFSEWHKS